MSLKKKLLNKFLTSNYKVIEPDTFIKRLRSLTIGEGMLHDGNIYLIDYALRNMPDDGIVLEIGSYGGLSTNLITYLLKKHKRNTSMINCDPWIYEGYDDHQKETPDHHIDGRDDITRVDYSAYMLSLIHI